MPHTCLCVLLIPRKSPSNLSTTNQTQPPSLSLLPTPPLLCISISKGMLCMRSHGRKQSKTFENEAHEEKRRKKFVGQWLRVTPKSWLTPKGWATSTIISSVGSITYRIVVWDERTGFLLCFSPMSLVSDNHPVSNRSHTGNNCTSGSGCSFGILLFLYFFLHEQRMWMITFLLIFQCFRRSLVQIHNTPLPTPPLPPSPLIRPVTSPTNLGYSTVTYKVLLNWPHSKWSQQCAAICLI